MIGLTNLWISGRPLMPPQLNLKRAVFVLGKIDEILTWEKERGQERDLRFGKVQGELLSDEEQSFWKAMSASLVCPSGVDLRDRHLQRPARFSS